ncbi:flippase-like domain-containing protein [Geomonas sp.]|uniref:flippase-like domain-containing protein n=1 Tax=Geomonas sp. TaxID=2651584 RepID=UPI002B47DB97|nr:flippase-like domain-containing protein [Geomonas sp.]HJV34487.1 flippase-like domain-containing protein [Geomonas sp.]
MSMRRVNLVLVGFASIALFLMFRSIDWDPLLRSLSLAKWYWALLVVPYGVTCYFWTLSWRLLVVDPAVPSLSRMFFLRLAGESLNQLTPTASLGGEPFKALRLQADGVRWQQAAASLIIHKALMVLSLVLYIFIGLALIPFTLPGISPRLALFCCLGCSALAAAGLVFLTLQRKNPCLSFLKMLKKIGHCPAVLAAKENDLASLDEVLAAFYRDHAGRGLLALGIFFLGWLMQAVEAWLIFALLGHRIPIELALCLDGLAQLVAGLGFMIPASLGVQDGGNILLSLGFKLGATLGAGFSIMRRLREAFWLLLGVVVAAREK